MSQRRVVYGLNPVRELVLARSRAVNVVYVLEGRRDPALDSLRELCKNRGVDVEERPADDLAGFAGGDARHQGAVAIAGEYTYPELEDVLDEVEARGEVPLVVVLDGVVDPHNLGAIVRSAHVLGAHTVVIPKDRAAPVTPAAVKAAAGATEHLPVARVTNVARALETLKARGIWTVGAVMSEPAPEAWALDLRGPLALVVGGEARGLRPLVQRGCDLLARIPMTGQVGSLNVSVAAGILLYEVARQRAALPAG